MFVIHWIFLGCFLLNVLNVSEGCHRSGEKDICDSLQDVKTEGHDEWYDVLVRGTKQTRVPTLTEEVFRNTPNIKKLYLTNVLNGISAGAFKLLKNLEILYIYNNDFETIDGDAFEGLKIKELLLDRNNMKTFTPGMFKHILNVEVVSIYNSDTKTLPVGVFNGSMMKKIFLHRNKIEEIEDGAFTNMNNLRLLNLGDNLLKTFDSSAILGNNRKLVTLGLNRNRFTELTSNMFTTIPNLESLYIQINKIRRIENETFLHVPKIAFLDLANNEIEEINPGLFPRSGMKKLTVFFLHNNRLTFIDNVLFTRLPVLSYITLGGNPFQCRCLKDIDQWMEEHKVTVLCKKDFEEGNRPNCVESSLSSTVCLYDVEAHRQLYDIFKEKVSTFPKLALTCETGNGFDKASLRD